MPQPNAPRPGGDEDNERLRALFQQTTTWRKYAREMYYFCQTQMVEWPCLSLDWMADRKTMMPGCDFTLQYLAVSTQALPGMLNAIQVLEVATPIESEDLEAFYGGKGALQKEVNCKYNTIKGHVKIDQRIDVESQVLKLRAMPQDTSMLAVKMSNGTLGIFDADTRPRDGSEESGGDSKPDLRLKGHRKPGFALEWSPTSIGFLASGSDDQQVLVYDLSANVEMADMSRLSEQQRAVAPLVTLTGHEDIVNDLAWHCTHDNVLVSASDDRHLRIWDTRQKKEAMRVEDAHNGGAFCVDFHPFASFLIASGGGDHVGKIWDMRRLATPSHQLYYHSNAIYNVQWAPFSETVLATAGLDRRTVMWDTQKIGLQPTQDDDEYAPPELSFVHSGHLTRVCDMRWCPNLEDEWLMASTDMTNVVQIYKPRRDLVYDYVAPDIFGMDLTDEQRAQKIKAHQEAEAAARTRDALNPMALANLGYGDLAAAGGGGPVGDHNMALPQGGYNNNNNNRNAAPIVDVGAPVNAFEFE